MKPQSVDNFILFQIFDRKNKISKLLISVGILANRGNVCKTERMDNVEASAVIKYFCKKDMSPTEIYGDLIKTLRDESPSYSTVQKWAAEFRRERESVEDYKRSGRPKEASTYVVTLSQR